ncbi:hypothetical protein PRIC2_007890 [Phytophthora ramorum]
MRTSFTDVQDKRLVALALEYESQRKRVKWKEIAHAMRGKHSAKALESRLCVLKRTYGRDLARFPRCFFSTLHTLALNQQDELLVVTDDVAHPIGECRFKTKGGLCGQNGVRDIITSVGMERFARLRISVGVP